MDETYVPGLNNRNSYSPETSNASPVQPKQVAELPLEKNQTVVGFLYTLSHKGEPEYWPLHIGVNTIGSSEGNDIQLSEATISDVHARINIKRLRTRGNALAASIVDVGSKNGIMLNDEELDYEQHTIKNEDIVVFGFNYKCVVLLVDPVRYGLGESDDFVSTRFENEKVVGNIPEEDPTSHVGIDPFAGFNSDLTQNVNGGGPDLSGGKTTIIKE